MKSEVPLKRVLLALLCLLAFGVSDPAEGAWVLWVESGDLQAFQRTGTTHTESRYASVEECVKAVDAEWERFLSTTEEPERHGFSRVTPTSAIIMMRHGSTNTTYIATYTWLPDTIQPPAPMEK